MTAQGTRSASAWLRSRTKPSARCAAWPPTGPENPYTLRGVSVSLATCAVAVLLAAADPAPTVRSIEGRGATAYDLKAIQRGLRGTPGSTLRRPVPELAEQLERRYHILGFPAAKVEGQ